jgi:hypothetical protein
MIQNLNKIKDMEFNFPIHNAGKAMYKVVSVNELAKTNSTTGNWGAVILAEDTKKYAYKIPSHIVFTLEYVEEAPYDAFKITVITSDNETSKIEVSKNGVKTPELFFESLKSLAEHSVVFNP